MDSPDEIALALAGGGIPLNLIYKFIEEVRKKDSNEKDSRADV